MLSDCHVIDVVQWPDEYCVLMWLSAFCFSTQEQVLHNIMAIFTFMGSSILRQDDAYSFQVISKIVDTIIPILVKVCLRTWCTS